MIYQKLPICKGGCDKEYKGIVSHSRHILCDGWGSSELCKHCKSKKGKHIPVIFDDLSFQACCDLPTFGTDKQTSYESIEVIQVHNAVNIPLTVCEFDGEYFLGARCPYHGILYTSVSKFSTRREAEACFSTQETVHA